jgi:hypothetical protein
MRVSDHGGARRASRDRAQHDPLRLGTLHSILKDVVEHHAMTIEDLVFKLRL